MTLLALGLALAPLIGPTNSASLGMHAMSAAGTVSLAGYSDAAPLASIRLDFQWDRGRVYRHEQRGLTGLVTVFDDDPAFAWSRVDFSRGVLDVAGYQDVWRPQVFNLIGIFYDGRDDYTGPSGRTRRVRDSHSHSLTITDPAVLALFDVGGAPVPLNWHYHGSAAVPGAGHGPHSSAVDECLVNGVVSVTYNPPSP